MINQKIPHDSESIKKLDSLLPPIPIIVVDTETSGNFPDEHGLLELSAMDLRNPNYNFTGECVLREGAFISSFDIEKNIHSDNIGRAIDPTVSYPPLTGDNPMLQLNNERRDYNLERYEDLRRRIKGVMTNKRPSENKIERNLKELMQDYFLWLKGDTEDPSLRIANYMEIFGRPSISIMGHNTSFDEGFINDGFKRAGIGKPEPKEVTLSDETVLKPTYFRAYQHPYRKYDTHDIVSRDIELRLSILGTEYEEMMKDFWAKIKAVDRFHRSALPTLQNSSGLTLDACLEYVGIPARIKSRTMAKHDSLTDVKLTAEVYYRTALNAPCLEEYKKFPLPAHLSGKYSLLGIREKLAS